MIRINLLGIREKPSARGGPAITVEGAKLTVLFVVILAVGVGVLLLHYGTLTNEKKILDEKMAKADKEKTRLASVKTELDQFEKRKQQYLKQINILEGLKQNQTGPVTLLNTIANTVVASDQLWLTSFENDGLKVTLDGVAGSVNTVADFIASLKRSGQFKNVEIKESYQDERSKDLPTFVFSITAERADIAPSSGKKG